MKGNCAKAAVVVLVIVLLFAAACGKQPTVSSAPATSGSFVENIYIEDAIVTEIIYADTQETSPVTENDSPASETAEPVSAVPATEAEQKEIIPAGADLSLEQALETVKNSINDVKNAKDFSAEQTMKVSIALTDCSISMLVTPLNALLKRFLGDHTYSYQFVNGECDDPREKVDKATPMYSIPPGDRLFALEPDGVAEWSTEKNGTDTTYTIKIVAEETTLQNPAPQYHSQAMDYLDLSDYDFGIGKIDEAKCTYPGADITVTVDENGKLLFYREILPVVGAGSGSFGISINAAYDGYIDEQWKIQW